MKSKQALITVIGFLFLPWAASFAQAPSQTGSPIVKPPVSVKKSWQDSLLSSLKNIDTSNGKEGSVGVYIKSLKTGKELSYHGDESWYIASGVKVPVALEVLRNIDAGTMSFATKVEVLDSDYIDGAGEINYLKPGSKVSLRMLLDQSLTFSDNTATDMLIRQIGLEKVNALTTSVVPGAFSPITTLVDVRRKSYGQFHPDAAKLSNGDFIRIKKAKNEKAKLDLLAKLLKVKRNALKYPTLDAGFEAYYSEKVNSATLRGYGLLLEKLSRGEVLKENTRKYLFDVLERIETGNDRIKAGLPEHFVFAHKTGTQHRRFCDMGVLTNGTSRSDEVIVVACIKNLNLEEAEERFQKIGQAISEAGIFPRKRP